MITIVGGDLDDWGYIPDFLNEGDPRPAREQIHEKQPGGWWPAPARMKFNPETLILTYPGDPPFQPLSAMHFRDELLLIYPGEWVVIVQPDKSTWEAARLD
jgi:hypothetical protein